MLFKCCNCGNIFEEDEIIIRQESRGEFWGAPCYEEMVYSPCCEYDYTEYREEDDEEDI